MQNERLARAALSRLMEPQDSAGLALVQVAGALDALGIATGQLSYGPALEQELSGALAEHSATSSWAGLGAASNGGRPGFRTSPLNGILPPCSGWAAG